MESNFTSVPERGSGTDKTASFYDLKSSDLYMNFDNIKTKSDSIESGEQAPISSQNLQQKTQMINTQRPQQSAYRRNDLNKVFIGGINYLTTEEALRSHFSKYGQISDCVVIRDPATNKSKGFGFVQYTDGYMVDELMKNRPHIIDNRELDVHRSIPRDQMKRTGQQAKSVNKLFIGGLNVEKVKESDLKNYFQSFGNVLNIHIPKDKETSKAKKFGFITFDDYDPVDKITLNHHVVINGMRFNVAKANAEEPKLQRSQSLSFQGNVSGAYNKQLSYKQEVYNSPYQNLKLQQHQQLPYQQQQPYQQQRPYQQQQPMMKDRGFSTNFGPIRSNQFGRSFRPTSPYQRHSR